MTESSEISKVYEMILNLSIHMLHSREAAEDATQDIFEKIVLKQDQFRGESSFSTWAYRIAYNYLIDSKRKGMQENISFSLFAQDINHYKAYDNEFGLNPQEEKIYSEEVKVGCTLAMLQCLKPQDRIIFILGNIFGISSSQGGSICGISSQNFRKKLSRNRGKIRDFMKENCGLMNSKANCHCKKRLLIAQQRGRISLENIGHHRDRPQIKSMISEMNQLDEIAQLFQSNPFMSDESEKAKIIAEQLAGDMLILNLQATN